MASGTNLLQTTPDKVVLIGDVGVGKTSLFVRFKSNEFHDNNRSHNPKEERFSKVWSMEGTQVSMTLWDTAGIERHMSTIPPTYFRSAKGVILVYSIADEETFESLTNWVDNTVSAMGIGNQDLVKVLVGNKADLSSERQVNLERAQAFARNYEIDDQHIMEISAKDGTGVQELFDLVAKEINPLAKNTPKPAAPANQKSKCCS